MAYSIRVRGASMRITGIITIETLSPLLIYSNPFVVVRKNWVMTDEPPELFY